MCRLYGVDIDSYMICTSTRQHTIDSQGKFVCHAAETSGIIFMKILISLIFCIAVLCNANVCRAQSISTQQTVVPSPTPYAITAQDGNSRVWSRTVYEVDPSGKVVTRQQQYHELASGLNHLVNGQFVASSEQIVILSNGTAVATNGQHQASFPGDIYQGEIQLLTPDGQLLQSKPLALAYFDGTNTVVIAELTNSVGLVGNNQVIYPDAFNTLSGFKADLRYTYTKAGFSQDVILRTQPPTPESLGLSGDTARLQIMTEFFSAPQPAITTTALPTQAGVSLEDESLDFGTMQMVPGRAFLMNQNAQDAGAMVSKHWVIVNGRQVLIEEVPVDAILEGLAALPMTAMNSNSSKNIHTASKHFQLPPQRLAAKNTSKIIMLAKTDLPAKGFVLDYQTVIGTFTNYTFQGDSTYYISGSLILLGNSTFEGGAVCKYATNGTISMTPGPVGTPSITWKGSAYRPVIFTGIDDNSVGDSIAGSTGNPTNYYGNPMLFVVALSPPPTLTGLRMSYAKTAISFGGTSINIYGAQFVNCQFGFGGSGGILNLRNALLANINTNISATSGFTFNAQNVTFSGSAYLWPNPAINQGNSLILSNCIFANITNLTVGFTTASGSYNGFYNALNFGSATTTNTFYPFRTVAGGDYYLANGCAFTNGGTTNIDSTLLSSLRQKTTCPPISFTNITFSTATNFSPQAARDTNTSYLNLGYHYDPLDYVFGGCFANSNFTFTAGTAVGWFRTTSGWSYAGYGIDMKSNVMVQFAGTVTAPDYWVRLNTVQEQDYTAGFGQAGIESQTSTGIPIVSGNFLRCSAMAGEQRSYFSDDFGYIHVIMVNSEFWGGSLDGYGDILYYTNCLMQRVDMELWNGNTTGNLTIRNSTFFGGTFSMQRTVGGALPISVRDSAFDCTNIVTGDSYGTNPSYSDYDYNAYTNRTDPFSIGGAHDVVVTNGFMWQPSWFGNYYQPTNSLLIDRGETNASLLGLYYFTTQTNQMPETNSIVDIGYHYMSLDLNGKPLDNDDDGVPDWEDADPNNPNVGILTVIIDSPTNGTTLTQ
jgi:hypothetical protein